MTEHRKTDPVPGRPYKAVAAFGLSFLTALYATLQGRTDLDSTRPIDWFIIVLGAIVTSGAVYRVTNPTVPTDDGYASYDEYDDYPEGR